MTEYLQKYSLGDIHSNGLPIPQPIIAKSNQNRNDYIQRFIDSLNELHVRTAAGCVFTYRSSGNYRNKETCTLTVLGAVTKQMMEMKLVQASPPQAPFPGLGIHRLKSECRERFRSPRIEESYYETAHHQCELSARTAAMLQNFLDPKGFDTGHPDFQKLRTPRDGTPITDILTQPGLTYTLDPVGDVVFVVHNVSRTLPPRLDDLSLNTLSGLSKTSKPPKPAAPEPSGTQLSTTQPQTHEQPTAQSLAREGNKQTLKIRASSRHLVLASPYFSRMLNGEFREASQFHTQGYYVCQIEDRNDLPFLLLLLMIIHGRTRLIPRKISLQRLADIAVLVDFYQCYEVVEVFTDMWITKLKPELPKDHNRDAELWLVIVWVLHRTSTRAAITQMIQDTSTQRVHCQGLPVPGE